MGNEKSLNLALTLQKVLEDNYDEYLRILSEEGVSEEEVREVLKFYHIDAGKVER